MASSQRTGFLMHPDDHEPELPDLDSGCSCFRGFWRRGPGKGDDQSYLLPEKAETRQLRLWLAKPLKKMREVSELIAGPKWKNFLRKFGAYFNTKIKCRKDFGYDSHNYALNFDDVDNVQYDVYSGGIGFSSRFAPPDNRDRSST